MFILLMEEMILSRDRIIMNNSKSMFTLMIRLKRRLKFSKAHLVLQFRIVYIIMHGNF
jgi:hypothetical protein